MIKLYFKLFGFLILFLSCVPTSNKITKLNNSIKPSNNNISISGSTIIDSTYINYQDSLFKNIETLFIEYESAIKKDTKEKTKNSLLKEINKFIYIEGTIDTITNKLNQLTDTSFIYQTTQKTSYTSKINIDGSFEELIFDKGANVTVYEAVLNIPPNSIITNITLNFNGSANRFKLFIQSDKLGEKLLSTSIKRLSDLSKYEHLHKHTMYYESTHWMDKNNPYSGFVFDGSSTYKDLTFGLQTPPITILDDRTIIKIVADEHKQPMIRFSNLKMDIYHMKEIQEDINDIYDMLSAIMDTLHLNKGRENNNTTYEYNKDNNIHKTEEYKSYFPYDRNLDNYSNSYMHVLNSNNCPNGLMYAGGHCYSKRDYNLAMEIYSLIPSIIPGSPDDPNFRYYYIQNNLNSSKID